MSYKIIIDNCHSNLPQPHELRAAKIVSEYFRSDITILRPGFGNTPDFEINGTKWELKSPLGKSKKTMENNLRNAKRQSKNIILDLSRCGLNDNRAVARIRYYLAHNPNGIKKVLVILKSQKILDIKG